MGTQHFLSGKVIKHTLPAIQRQAGGAAGTPSVPAPRPTDMKRLLLPQGELAQICDGEEEIRYIAYAELRSGGTRGNHYHEFKKEGLYIISGEILLWVQDIDSNLRDSIPLRAGELAVIGTRVAHALQIVTPGHAIEYSPAKFDPTDVYPFRLIE